MNLQEVMDAESQKYHHEVPYGRHLTGEDGQTLNEAYYVQYRMDDVQRIWATASTDSLALSQLVKIDYESTVSWGDYTVEEMKHDKLFLQDLSHHGVSEKQVANAPRLPTTQRIIDFLETSVAQEGPLAALAYSIYLECGSETDASKTVDNARRHYGAEAVRGSHAHLHIDGEEQHYVMVSDIVRRVLAKNGEDEARLFELLRKFGELFRAYYRELYELTVVRQSAPANRLLKQARRIAA